MRRNHLRIWNAAFGMTAGEQIARAIGNNMIEDAPIVEFWVSDQTKY